MEKNIAIHWFRQDLRVSDNPALTLASKHKKILPIYILDDENAEEFKMGAASRWWLFHSLSILKKSLGDNLSIYKGNPHNIIEDITNRFNISSIYWNRCYEPWRTYRDTKLKDHFKTKGINVESCNGSLLWEPWTIKKNDGTPYKVFTPFYRKGCLQSQEPRKPIPKPINANFFLDRDCSISLEKLELLSNIKWYKKLDSHWEIGEVGANKRLKYFLKEGIEHYKDGRNLPEKPYVSRLSPHLHFGEISPNQLWYAVQKFAKNKNIDHFCSELGWREFSHNLLYYNPQLPTKNLQSKFNNFPWSTEKLHLKAWKDGQTGIPMVDAGMRQLWQTGYMHNRLRMIVGSFLVKNLLIHWSHGERWFWETLLDADLANNSASWQWIAGCGSDAAPYFRIFNPVIQGQKFDSQGNYVRLFVPEIASLPNKYLFNPWTTPKKILEECRIELGKNYPKPVVDLNKSRDMALLAFKSLKD